jgi:L-seryl-tRNA(Ser) seleniumtransferase
MSGSVNQHLRSLPSVDSLLAELGVSDLPRPVVLAVVRRTLAEARRRARAVAGGTQPPAALLLIRAALDDLRRTRIQPVINATGIIIHTNLGRSPLSARAAAAVHGVAINYNNLEYDLDTGERGSRGSYVEHNLAVLCRAEQATVVNNCAAALVLVLRHFAAAPPRNRVIISRGELVQIGGGFRIPDILLASGAELAEIGTTNKTTLDDYRSAIDDRTALILRVHRSNFYMGGFVSEPASADIARLARTAEVPFLEDLGSGATFDTAELGGGEHERTAADAIADGAQLVCFSGDKLLGGPQAGIIAGSANAVGALKANPFFRALRCDKLILTALQATTDLLLAGEVEQLPIRQMMLLPLQSLAGRAGQIVSALQDAPVKAAVGRGVSQVGGGSLPRTQIPSVSVDLQPQQLSAVALAEALRRSTPPVVGYVSGDQLHLDLRTVFPHQDAQLVSAVRGALAGSGSALP